MRSVLIVKFGAIGDVVMLIPAAHEMHRAGYRVDWVCGETVLPVLELYGWIHPIVADERGLLRGGSMARLRALTGLWRQMHAMGESRRYDLVATFYYDWRYRLMALPVRTAKRIALSLTDRERRLLPGRHHTDEYARILLGLVDEVRPNQLAPVPVDAKKLPEAPLPGAGARVVIAAGGARNLLADDGLRRWPVENYAELARALRMRQVEVVLIGGVEDEWVVMGFDGLDVVNCVGKLSLPQTLALLDAETSGGTVLVTHDTGPLHLGGITRAGVVGVFGPTDPRGRLPQRAGTVALWGGEGFACRPCYDGQRYAHCQANDCMRQVTVEMVLREVMSMLDGPRHGMRRGPRVLTPDSTVGVDGLTRIGEVGQG